jgi:hypothetical protein
MAAGSDIDLNACAAQAQDAPIGDGVRVQHGLQTTRATPASSSFIEQDLPPAERSRHGSSVT